jgi:Flp pilus assembly protein TadD
MPKHSARRLASAPSRAFRLGRTSSDVELDRQPGEYSGLALAYRGVGRLPEAEQMLRKALELAPARGRPFGARHGDRGPGP